MPQTYKLLGQVNPTANTPANVYSVPASTEGIVNSIIISNLSSSNVSFSLTVRPTSEALADKHFIVRACVIPASDTLTMTLSLTMQANAVLAANTNSSNLSISAHGVEIS